MFNLDLQGWLLVGQTVCLIASTVLILLQQRGASIGGAFGSSSEVYLTKRGIEKWVVNATVVSVALFIIIRFISLYI